MIRFGPAGIPLSCKGRTLRDGIEDVHSLGLTALEIQMIRTETTGLYPEEEEVGLTIRDITDKLVIEISRDDEIITDADECIKEDDILVCMNSGITKNFDELCEIGDLSKRLDVSMSVHTPYYMDLSSNNEFTEICIDGIRHAAILANAFGGRIITTNLGLYAKSMNIDDATDNIYKNVIDIMDWWKDNDLKPKLGVEITGQQNVFGSLEQILDICDQVDGLAPVVNWSNYYSRTDGELLEVDDFKYIFDQIEPYCNGAVHSLFAGVEYCDDSEFRLTPIKKGDLKFETLAECLVDVKPDITIISSSSLLEHDAMYMRIIHERNLLKKVGKMMRQKKKNETDTDIGDIAAT